MSELLLDHRPASLSELPKVCLATAPDISKEARPGAFDVDWLTGPSSPVTAGNEVHIWKAALNQEKSLASAGMISREEWERASRFHFEKDRIRFIAARASLRRILGRYLNVSPSRLEFGQAKYGKPFLTSPQLDLRFNLSHSGDLALVAVTLGREVGVDVELMRADFATDDVAQHFFSPSEVAELTCVNAEQRTRAFFNCWTRKEAYIKARGEGLSLALDSFDVSLAPGEPAAVLASRFDPADASRWTMQELFPANGYAGAVAIERDASPTSIRQFVLAE